MAWIDRDTLRRLGRVFQFRSMRADLDAEVDAEIGYHLERTEAELLREGASPPEARREAARRFGDVRGHRERLRRINRRRGRRERMIGMYEAAKDALRHALRSVRCSPGVSATVVITLALGIGANATMFGIVDRLLLRAPDHVTDPDRVVRLYVQRAFLGRVSNDASVAYPDVRDWLAADGFAAVAAISNVWGSSGNLTVGHGAAATRVMGQQASPSFFPLLGVQPLHGRFYREEEDVAGAARVAVLGFDFWRRRFGGDPSAVGREIVLAGIPHEIVGVVPPGFTGVELRRIDVWTPLRSAAAGFAAGDWEDSRGWYWLRTVARLAPGVAAEEAAAEATALHRAGREEDSHYDPEARVLAGSLIAARGIDRSDESVVTRWLAAVSAVVLLIACANVTNILLARGTRQRADIGVRLALGVSSRRLVGQLLLESVLLALLGGLAALAVAHWGAQAVRVVLLPDVHWAEPPINLRVLSFTFAVSTLTGVLAGLVPAANAGRQDVTRILTGDVRRGGASRSRLRTGMTVLQTSLSVVLLVAAGLFVRSLISIRAIDLGFEPDGILAVLPEFDDELLPGAERQRVLEGVAERLRSVPQVGGVTVAAAAPFYSSISIGLEVPDVPESPSFSSGGPYVLIVDEEYFSTMGIRILEGRGFTAADTAGAPKVAVVESSMARAYWPDGSALGKCLKIGGAEEACSTIVGIAEDTARQSLLPEEAAQYYAMLDQRDTPPFAMFVRAAGEPTAELALTVRGELESAHPGVRFANVQPLREMIDPQARSWELGASMFSAFGVLALIIAAIGLYGVMAFDIAQRTREIGIRSALGAEPRRLARMVVRQALGPVAASLLLGLGVALVMGRWLESLLFDVAPSDPVVLVSVVIVLAAVTGLAAAAPARRATRVDPVEALRVE